MSQSNSSSLANSEAAHLNRLEQLERELALLRRELGDESSAPALPTADFQALVFEVNDTSYGIPIAIVREIVRYVKLTSVSDVPHAVIGAINVRGEVLPVLDARRRLGQPVARPNLSTPILLLATQKQAFGLVVDSVDVVCEIRAKDVVRPTGAMAQSACVSGVATVGSRVVQILDVDRTLSVRQWKTLHSKLGDSDDPEPAPADIVAKTTPETAVTGNKTVASKKSSTKTTSGKK